MRTCVYTSIFGQFDTIKDHAPQDIDADFFVFTDIEYPEINNAVKIVRDERFSELDPRMRSKVCKLLPQMYFKKKNNSFVFNDPLVSTEEYDYILYIDGSITIKNTNFFIVFDVSRYVERMGHDSPSGEILHI